MSVLNEADEDITVRQAMQYKDVDLSATDQTVV